jgi:hypothetical protein
MALRNIKKLCWNGAFIDTGAQRTVVDLAHARAYCKFLGILFALSITKRVFVFGVDKRNSLSILHMQLPMPNGSFIMLEVDVLPKKVPMLLGLGVLDKFGLSADTVHVVLHCTAEDWKLPLVLQARARVPRMVRYRSNYLYEVEAAETASQFFAPIDAKPLRIAQACKI